MEAKKIEREKTQKKNLELVRGYKRKGKNVKGYKRPKRSKSGKRKFSRQKYTVTRIFDPKTGYILGTKWKKIKKKK